jgi:hypothetical protein
MAESRLEPGTKALLRAEFGSGRSALVEKPVPRFNPITRYNFVKTALISLNQSGPFATPEPE